MHNVLQGARMSLVLLEPHHLARRVEYLNDPEVQATLNFDYPVSLSKTEAWFSKNVLASHRVDFTFLRISTGEIIGFGGFINIDRAARKAELYIFIGDKSCWGQGFGREGYKLLVNYGFLELGLERIYAYQLSTNERAVKSITKLGWTIEGLLRRDIWSHGQLKDRYLASILRSDWIDNNSY